MKAQAMVLVKPGRLELQEFKVLPPPPGYALIKTKITSVCASDVRVFRGQVGLAKHPVIMGREMAGEVVALGEGSAWRFTPGELVTVEPFVPCGQCAQSRSDYYYHLCPHAGIYGITLSCTRPPHLFGGYSEYFYLVPGALAHRVPVAVPSLAASLAPVVGNGVRWVKTLGRLGLGEAVAVVGPGAQGLCTVAAAREAGAGGIVALGLARDAARLALALEFGADGTVDVESQDPLREVPRLLGRPPDLVVETSGTPAGIRTALELVRPGGRVVAIGLSGGELTPVDFDALVWKNLTLRCGVGQAGNLADATWLLATGHYPFAKINNTLFRLDQLEEALEATASRPAGFIKAAVVLA